MKKVFSYFVMVVVFFTQTSVASSSCVDCTGGYAIEESISALDTVYNAFNSEAGEEMIGLVDEIDGEINAAGTRVFTLPQGNLFLIPAGENEETQFNIAYIDKGGTEPFLRLIESPKEVDNIFDIYMNVYFPSGEVISIEGFGTTNFLDIKPSINWNYCWQYALCSYLVPWPAEYACYWFLYKCIY